MPLVLTTFMATNSRTASIQKPAPKPQSDIEKLEAEFKELDRQDEDVRVVVSGDKESSGNINIRVDTIELSSKVAGIEPADSGLKIDTKKRLDIDLSKINIPDEYFKRKVRAAFLKKEQTGLLPGVKVMQIDATDIYEVVEDYTYNADTFSITVRKGFRYDRASVPKPFWFIDRDSLSNVPPLFHDLLYRHGGALPPDLVAPYRKFSRKETDDLFLELMTKCGVKKWRRNLAYQAVRQFSGFAWKN